MEETFPQVLGRVHLAAGQWRQYPPFDLGRREKRDRKNIRSSDMCVPFEESSEDQQTTPLQKIEKYNNLVDG